MVDSDVNTNFVVYLVGAKANATFPGWMCGGSIIHPYLVLTSAACLYDVKYMYVIAGYRKYVSTEHLEEDTCTKHMKKRVVSFCVNYEFGHLQEHQGERHTSVEKMYRWSKFDIGVARVESPIDFYDSDYLKYCSYLPNSIATNYNTRYELPGSDVVVFGWGHATYYRPDNDVTDYNEEYLRYATSIIVDRYECEKHFKIKYVQTRVGNNFICADGKGNFDAHGRLLSHKAPEKFMCGSRRFGNDSGNHNKAKCFQDIKTTDTHLNDDLPDTINVKNTRRNGICQNDHGSPLVLWVGGRAYVVGVASAFHVNKNMECVGPYLYTSVLCSSRFVHCVLREQNTIKSRRAPSYCDAPDIQRGFKIEETNIKWSDDDLDDLDNLEDLGEEQL